MFKIPKLHLWKRQKNNNNNLKNKKHKKKNIQKIMNNIQCPFYTRKVEKSYAYHVAIPTNWRKNEITESMAPLNWLIGKEKVKSKRLMGETQTYYILGCRRIPPPPRSRKFLKERNMLMRVSATGGNCPRGNSLVTCILVFILIW